MPPIQFLADRKEAGQTVSSLLRKRFGLTWNQVKKIVANGHVRVAGFAVTDPAHRIKARNRIWIREGVIERKPEPGSRSKTPADPAKPIPTQPKQVVTLSDKKLRHESQVLSEIQSLTQELLVYVDDAIVVVNKPIGLTTMRHDEEAEEFGARGRAYLPKTLADFLPQMLGRPNQKIYPVHRIDRDTTGLVVFALTTTASSHLTKQFRNHTIERVYQALVRGEARDGRIESILVPDRGDGRRGSLASGQVEDLGKRAVTRLKTLEKLAGFTLVECRLETGRTHQVRIHLGEAGTPLCGERVYDRPIHGKPWPDSSGAKRPMLHATRLGLAHPETGEIHIWDAPLPDDFQAVLARLRGMMES